jgi:hypothetical protein
MNKETTMRRPALILAMLSATTVLAAACDTDDDPQVLIVSPSAGSTLTLDQGMKARFTISANDFEIKPGTQCNGNTKCGPAYLNIDGDACNQPGQPYNAILGDSTLGQDFFIQADFSLCPAGTQIGSHTVTVSLHDPSGNLVNGEGGGPARATVSVTTVRGGT